MNNTRKIIHIDMDCFFAAVELLDKPHLKNKPIAVGGSSSGRGVICTASYEARRYGVRSAQSSVEALKLCPHLIFIKPNTSRYQYFAQKIMKIYQRYTSIIQPASIDEAYLDVTNSKCCHSSATLIAKDIQRAIFNECGLSASAGVAPNKFLAKIGSDWNKPQGLCVIAPTIAEAFAREIPIKKVPGVGSVTQLKCSELGITKLKDILPKNDLWLIENFGKFGPKLKLLAKAIDHSQVKMRSFKKSLSAERTFINKTTNYEDLIHEIESLKGKVLERLDRLYQKSPNHPSIAKFFVKIKSQNFEVNTHEKILDISHEGLLLSLQNSDPTNCPIHQLFKDVLKRQKHAIRLAGVGVRFNTDYLTQQLETYGQLHFFAKAS